MRQIIYSIFLIMTMIVSGQESELFTNANAKYAEEKYKEAITDYKSVLDGGLESVALYYNLGNAHYKLNEIGPSIYYYEKALKLDPSDADVKNNLKFAQRATVDQIETLPEGVIKKTMRSITNTFGHDTWAWLSIFGVLLFVGLFIAYFTAGSSGKKRVFFLVSWIALAFGLVALGFAFKQYDLVNNSRYAILFVKETTVKSEPNLRSEAIFTLHEGTKVAVLEESREWKKIRLVDGKIGWLPKEELKEL